MVEAVLELVELDRFEAGLDSVDQEALKDMVADATRRMIEMYQCDIDISRLA